VSGSARETEREREREREIAKCQLVKTPAKQNIGWCFCTMTSARGYKLDQNNVWRCKNKVTTTRSASQETDRQRKRARERERERGGREREREREKRDGEKAVQARRKIQLAATCRASRSISAHVRRIYSEHILLLNIGLAPSQRIGDHPKIPRRFVDARRPGDRRVAIYFYYGNAA